MSLDDQGSGAVDSGRPAVRVFQGSASSRAHISCTAEGTAETTAVNQPQDLVERCQRIHESAALKEQIAHLQMVEGAGAMRAPFVALRL